MATNVLSGLEVATDIEEAGDSLGGYSLLESEAYVMDIKQAYLITSAKGATGISLELSGDNNAMLNTTVYVTSGVAKGSKNYYIRKDKATGLETKHYLPGFNQIQAICQLTLGKNLSELAAMTDKKHVNLYDKTAGAKVATEVDSMTPLVDQKIALGILKQLVDKNKLDPATGKYVATGETREENEIDKVFHPATGLTILEAKAGATEAKFLAGWRAKWAGKVKDKTTKTPGVVAGGAPAVGGAAPTTNQFK